MKVFFYVQHLLGIGHLKRAATIAQALREGGFEVTLASGGAPVEGIPVLQLPPATSDASFRHLLDGRGQPVDEAWKERRRARLLEAYRASEADALIVELFPFGRRQMRFELIPLLEEAASRLVVCSVRDILQPKPSREEEALACFERYFHRLLVHGDPRVAPFASSFSRTQRLEGRFFYTGYVAQEMAERGNAGADEVLVSAGGGAVGRKLVETAIRARPLSALRNITWRILAGVNAKEIETLRFDGVIVERARSDFTQRLQNCVVSVSQAGYNTVVETLQAGARAVLVPFASSGESEQTLRASLLAQRGLVNMLEEDALSPAALAAAIDRAAAAPRPAAGAIDLGGARRSAALLREWLA
ncbi:MAG TPA: glycosyltransferase [Burkholderiales bacterium]|nr:glycosyltransferase [Burkholderiales bacterium]